MHQLAVYTRALLRLVPLRRFVVVDTSMQPALRPGDRLVVLRRTMVRTGDVVVCRDPEARLTMIVKRVASVAANGDLTVRGDNPNVSRDSRQFGVVPPGLVIGKVIYRYLPGSRRGRL